MFHCIDPPIRGALAPATPTTEPDPLSTAGALLGGLGDGAVHEHVPSQAGAHRHHRVDHRGQLGGALDPAGVPAHLEPQSILHLRRARAAEADAGSPTRARVRRDAVDVVGGEAGIGDRLQGRVDREVESAAAQTAADVGLPDPRDDRPLLELRHDERTSPQLAAGSDLLGPDRPQDVVDLAHRTNLRPESTHAAAIGRRFAW